MAENGWLTGLDNTRREGQTERQRLRREKGRGCAPTNGAPGKTAQEPVKRGMDELSRHFATSKVRNAVTPGHLHQSKQ